MKTTSKPKLLRPGDRFRCPNCNIELVTEEEDVPNEKGQYTCPRCNEPFYAEQFHTHGEVY